MITNQHQVCYSLQETQKTKQTASHKLRQIASKLWLVSAVLATGSVLAGPGGVCTITDFNAALQSTGTPVFTGVPGATNGDDNSAADSIVRTNDTYVYRFNYKIPSGKKEENITFSATLPLTAGKKTVVWDGLPAQCEGPGSSVSADGLTLVCNIGDQDRTTEGDLVAGVLAQVKSTILGANGDLINVAAKVQTNDCAVGAVADAPAPPVTISARQKVDFRKDVIYTQQQGYKFSRTSGGTTEDGYLVAWYVYMDQYDPAGASSKGGQAINSPVSFNDVSTNFPPGSIWFDCYRTSGSGQGNISCPPRYTPVGSGPNASSSSVITITARAGEENEFLVAGGKNTDVQIDPNTSQPQRLATFAVRYWVPLSEINNPANQTPPNSGQIDLVNKIQDFTGTTNSGAPIIDQRLTNNELVNTVVAVVPGSYYKYVARNWLGTVWNQTTYGGVNPSEYQLDGTNNWGDSGTALVYPSQVFFPRLDYYNPAAADTTSPLMTSINGPSANITSILCENFDNTQVELAILPGSGGHAAGWYYGAASSIAYGAPGNANSTFPLGYKVEYGVSSTGSGNPGRTSRCEDSDAQWFDTVTAADAAGKKDLLNKVRMKIPSLGGGQNSLFVIAQRTRPGLNGTYIIDYTPVKGATIKPNGGNPGDWLDSAYTSRACTTCPNAVGPGGDNTGLSTGKRVQLTTALARVSKQAYNNANALATNQAASTATGNRTLTYVLTPSLQSIVPSLPQTFVTIVDRLPAPVTYVDGSANIPPDSVASDAGGTTLSWTLNNVTPNTTLPTITFVALVPVDIPPNTQFVNTVFIESPDDSSPLAQRRGEKAVTIISPPGINVTKSTNTPLIEPNNTMTFKLAIANIEINATKLDIIDVLPYIGDSTGVTQNPLPAQAGRTPASAFNGLIFMNSGAVTVLSSSNNGASGPPVIRYSKKNPTVAGTGSTALLIDPSAPNNSTTVADGWCLESEFGAANPTCPLNMGQATAFRVSNFVLGGNSVGSIQLRAATNANVKGDVYTNRFGIRTDNSGFNFLRSNDVPVRVVLGSISGKVYVDADGSATQGAPASEPPIPGTTITLCAVDPASNGGTCPAGTATVATTTTGPGGTYTFSDLISRPYWIVETKPAGYANGPTNATGSAGGTASPNNFAAINLPIGANASNYNFGHRLTDLVTTVQTPAGAVLPGSVVNATVTFGNVSQVPSENTTVTIKVTPGLPAASVTFTIPTGWQLPPGGGYNSGTGEIQFIPTTPGGTLTPGYQISFPVSIVAPPTGTITITSSITNTIGDLTPITTPSSTDPKRNAHERPITVLGQQIDVRKRAGTPYTLDLTQRGQVSAGASDSTFAVPYRITVANKNLIAATNVQVADFLPATFPSPAVILSVLQQASATVTTNFTGAATGAVVSNGTSTMAAGLCQPFGTAYNGNSQPQMLAGNFNLAPGESCNIEFTVLVNYPAPAAVPEVAQKNTAWASASDVTNVGPTFNAAGSPTFPPGVRATDASTDSPSVPPSPTGTYPAFPGPGGGPSNGDAPDPTPVTFSAQTIDVRKASSAPVQIDLSGKRFRVSYTVNLSAGAGGATNVQMSENLRFTFPQPAVFTVTATATAAPLAGANACASADINPGFNGAAWSSANGPADYNLLGASGNSSKTLLANEQCILSFTVEVDYGAGAVPVAPPQNRVFGSSANVANSGPPFLPDGSKNGDNPAMIAKDTSTDSTPAPVAGVPPVFGVAPADPGKPATPKSDSGSGTLMPMATLETVKSTTGPAVIVAAGKYRVPYEMTVVARGSASFALPNVQVIDNLAQAFQGGPLITVPSSSQSVASINGATCPAVITNIASPNLTFFPGNTSLTVDQGCTFRFFVEVDYATPNVPVVTTIQYNQVYATSIQGAVNTGGVITVVPGTSTTNTGSGGGLVAGSFAPPSGPGITLIAHDASTNGNTLPTSPAGDRPLPTPVQFAPPPTIDAIKFARNLTRAGAPITQGDVVEWTVIYKNSGTTVANNVQVTDARQTGYSNSVLTSAVRIPDNTLEPIQPNSGYNGTSDVNLLFTTAATPVNLAPGEQLVFKINSTVNVSSGNVTNQASLTANELGGSGGTKILTSAVDKGTTLTCPPVPTNVTCLPVGVTLPADTITSTTAPLGPKGAPNTLPVLLSSGISGKVYLDRNTNGTFDGADTTPFPGTLITLCATSGIPCPSSEIRGTTTTNATGDYNFATVPPGTYYIQQAQPTGYGSSTPNERPVTMVGAPIANENFGETAASISGTVYRDNNTNNVLDAGDVGLGAVQVNLCLSTDGVTCTTLVTSTTTLSAGNVGSYTFSDLAAPPVTATYLIQEVQSTVAALGLGLTNGATNLGTLVRPPNTAGAAGTVSSPNSRVSGITWTPSATPATQPSAVGTGYNFGEVIGSDISGRVFYDRNRNGTQDTPGTVDTGIGGVLITLCRVATVACPSADVVGTTTTASNGDYSFAGVPVGNYFMQETQPAGYGSTPTVSAPGVTDVRPITVTTVNLTGIDFADTLSSISGLVYLDSNANGAIDPATETTRLSGITITLTGVDATGTPVSIVTVTSANGTYTFGDLKTGTYVVTESQPPIYGTGGATPGTTGGTGGTNTNVISAIVLPAGTDSLNNNFGDVPRDGAISGSLWRDNDHDRIKDPGEPPLVGWTVQLIRTPVGGGTPTVVATATSGPNGEYSITGQEVGGGYSVRFISPAGIVFGGAVNGEQGPGSAQPNGGTTTTGELTGITLRSGGAANAVPQQSLPVDPAGVVYDSDTRLPVPGATVVFGPIGACPGYDPAIHLVGGAANASQVVGADGFYQFLLTGPVGNPPPACQYGITITPPAGYAADPAVPPQATPFTPPNRPPNDPVLIVPNAGAPQAGEPTTWHQAFNLGPNSRDVVNNHVPLIANNRPVLFISKVAGKTTVELGDNVKYTVKVRYVSGSTPLPVLRVVDSMPAGFKLIPGTSFVSVPTGSAPVAVPAGNILGAPGAEVTYNIPLPGGVFNVGQEMELTYRVRVGVGSMQGDGINRAQARSVGVVRSNIAQAKVKVNPGVFTSDACIVGKIYTDCNNNHIQDAEEVGVPGVRLYLQDGTYLVSDSEGKYSICGLEPRSHVLKVDQITLPRGSRLTTTSNRNLGNADSLWLDLKNGEMQQADFAIGSCSNTVLEQVKARRAQGGVRSIDNERKSGTSLKFEGKSANYPDQGTDGANQPLVQPRPPGAPPPQSDAENNTPVPQLPASSSNTPGNNIRLTK